MQLANLAFCKVTFMITIKQQLFLSSLFRTFKTAFFFYLEPSCLLLARLVYCFRLDIKERISVSFKTIAFLCFQFQSTFFFSKTQNLDFIGYCVKHNHNQLTKIYPCSFTPLNIILKKLLLFSFEFQALNRLKCVCQSGFSDL